MIRITGVTESKQSREDYDLQAFLVLDVESVG
jgi:hypothetical protein